MAIQFKRLFELKFFKESESEPFRVMKDLRIDFDFQEIIKFNKGNTLTDKCKIDIYNVAPATYQSLSGNNPIKVELRVGYATQPNDLDLVFKGYIKNTSARRKLPDHITTLWCIPDAYVTSNKKHIKGTTEGKTTVRETLQLMSDLSGVSVSFNASVPDEVLDRPWRHKTFYDYYLSCIADVLIANNLGYRTLQNGVEVLPNHNLVKVGGSNSNDLDTDFEVKMVDLRGTPNLKSGGIDIPLRFIGSVRAGSIVSIKQLTNTEQDGTGTVNGVINIAGIGNQHLFYASNFEKYFTYSKYQVKEARHVGSNYTDDFYSYLNCFVYASNTIGQSLPSGDK